METTATNHLIKPLLRYCKPATQAEFDTLHSFDLSKLLGWLGQRDDSLRYYLALELDIPLAHLNATCETVTRLSTEF
ncbi:MAG: hypothetical protein MJA28_12025 [Gammaproteobacteria bacterium]|nr:hypothetical protein [Gammaproteobacteria bacterium]